MPFEIKRESTLPRIVRMGHAPRVIESEPVSLEALETPEIIEPHPVKEKKQRGRPGRKHKSGESPKGEI